MSQKAKSTQSEIDGVQYRRAKLWQVILYACNGLVGMSVYSLIGLASYSASIGYGITTLIVGYILTGTRIFDAITDPLVAFLYDRINTRFGKLRILLAGGFAIEAVALLAMFDLVSSKGFGTIMFILLYCLYVIGYTITNMTAQTIPALLTNDPKQRPVIGVWTTAFNYLVPITLTIVLNVVMLPMYGGTYNQAFLSAACRVCLLVALVGIVLVCVGVSGIDKAESFTGTSETKEHLKIRDMVDVRKGNRPLLCYIISAASDKIAQQTASQSIVVTLMFGIVIGNMGLSTILNAIGLFPSIIFAILGAKYAGKYGSQKTIVVWTWIGAIIAAVSIVFFALIDPKGIAVMLSPLMILYVILTFALNGAKMCITTANTSFMADIIDYELDRSGRYVPAVVTGVYSLIDKIVSAFGATIAAGAVALIGYTTTMPQPGDPCTTSVFWMAMTLNFGLPIFGWICTLIAMRFCHLDKAAMVEVQKHIHEKKAALQKNAQ